MLPKPPACTGCPAYGNGKGFVPDEIIPGSEVVILGCGQTKDEELQGKPFAGRTGQWMERDFLPLAGLARGRDVSIVNLLKCRWTENGKKTDKFPKPTVFKEMVEHCTKAHLRVPAGTSLVIAQGEEAWTYASGGVGPLIGKGEDDESGKWRGYLAPNPVLGIPTLGVLHIAYLFRNRRYLVPSQWDWQKVKLIRAGHWPLPIPPCPTEENWRNVEAWFQYARGAEYVVVDTEFDRYTKDLLLVGLGASTGPSHPIRGLQFRWVQGIQKRETFTRLIHDLVQAVPIVFHNAMADLPVIKQATGIHWSDYKQIEDTMLAHAVLYSEWPHDLEFCDSLTGKHSKLKHLAQENPLLYNWGDVLSTHYLYQWCLKEFAKDPASERIYREQSLKLYGPRLKALEDGIAVNKERAIELFGVYGRRQDMALRIAQAYCGYPVNIGSEKQLKYWLYSREGMPVQKDKDTKKPSIGEDAIAVLRRRFYDFDPEQEKDGLSPELALSYIDQGAHPLLEARAMYAGASQIISHYLKPLLKDEYRG